MEENKEKNENQFLGLDKKWIFLFLGILFVWIISWGAINLAFSNMSERGQFGDQFGAINSLFSGFAFAGLIVTIALQREELRAQKDELELTRKEIRGQKQEMEEQNKTMALQRFETSFFNMLSQHNEMVTNLKGGSLSGKALLSRFSFDLEYNLISFSEDLEVQNKKLVNIEFMPHLDAKFENSFSMFLKSTGSYFRSLECFLNFVDRSSVDDKRAYIEIILSQLTDEEVKLLLMYGLSGKGRELKNLIEKFSLARYVDTTKKDLYQKLSVTAYVESAFNPNIQK